VQWNGISSENIAHLCIPEEAQQVFVAESWPADRSAIWGHRVTHRLTLGRQSIHLSATDRIEMSDSAISGVSLSASIFQ
jgi:hypothetical protein